MFLGHFAVGLAAKGTAPRISLGTLILAAVLADLACFIFLIAGIESFAPVPGAKINRVIGENIAYSHSLMMGSLWGAILAAIYFVRRRSPRVAWMLFAVVLSHWVLDVISHRPDMPIAPGIPTRLGFGLWNSLPATVVIEGGFWLLAIILYLRATKSQSRLGVVVLWIGLLLITLIGLSNPTQGMDPDPVRAGIGGLVVFSLFVAWAYWMDRIRVARRA
jgi:hypothetical protein